MLKDTEHIKTLDIKELYPLFSYEIRERGDKQQTYNKVRYGIYLHFDIHEWIEGTALVKAKTGRAIIKGRNYDMRDVRSELEARAYVMKKWLIENLEDEKLVNIRVK